MKNMLKKIIYKKFIQPKDSYFRAGAGIVISNMEGKVLVFERSDKPGEFQFPQGGLDPLEDPRVGALRELFEETALSTENLINIKEIDRWFTYEFPAELAIGETYRGQTQKWFTAGIAPDTKIDLSLAHDKEFTSYKWVSKDTALKGAVGFKQKMYKEILRSVE